MKNFFSLGFSTRTLRDDVSAGVVKSIDSVTGGMANALLAGVNPMFNRKQKTIEFQPRG